MDAVRKNRDVTNLELAATNSRLKEACAHIEILHKEKGVAMRDNASSYERSIQLETKVSVKVKCVNVASV